MSHRGGTVHRLDAAVGPQVRPAHAGGGDLDDGVGRLLELRVWSGVQAYVARRMQDCSVHELLLYSGLRVAPSVEDGAGWTVVCCERREQLESFGRRGTGFCGVDEQDKPGLGSDRELFVGQYEFADVR